MSNGFTPRIPKPADFKPESHFTEGKQKGRPRCPAWAKQAGAQCKHPAGHGTDKLHQVGACCKVHGGNSKGPPKGSKNAVDPDKPHSRYVRFDQLKELDQFDGLTDVDLADILVRLSMAKTIKIASAAADEEAAKLITAISSANAALRTKQAVERNQLLLSEIRERQGKGNEDKDAIDARTRAELILEEVLSSFEDKG